MFFKLSNRIFLLLVKRSDDEPSGGIKNNAEGLHQETSADGFIDAGN